MTTVDTVRGVEVKGEGWPVQVVVEAHPGWTNGWLAKVLAQDETAPGGFRMQFLRPEERKVNRKGNGTKTFVLEEPGLYQAESVYRSYRSYRVFFLVDGEGKVEILGTTATKELHALKQIVAERLNQKGGDHGQTLS